MTRINLVHPSKLCDQHLLAELRELPRIPNGVLRAKLKRHYDNAPKQYTLGTGHVKFFVDKLQWLEVRYDKLLDEAYARGFCVQNRFPEDDLFDAPSYTPTSEEIAINVARICERMPQRPRYRSRPIGMEQALLMLKI